jgi:curved DNA-binding protein
MEFKDYYAALGVTPKATQADVKRAYRKLARKFHPDVSKEADAEVRFKEVAEAHEALIDVERRAAYDEAVAERARSPESSFERGQEFSPPPGWGSGFEFNGRDGEDYSEFFDSLFGRTERTSRPSGKPRQRSMVAGEDHHAKVEIDLEDAYRGARRQVTLHTPVVYANGTVSLQDRQLEVNIPTGVRAGQRLRLAGQGAPGQGGAPSGDLYLEIVLRSHRHFRVDERDVYVDLPIAPWEAALGATVIAPTPQGDVELVIAPGSVAGRKLRLKGKGLPGKPPGDLYVVLGIAMPPADSEQVKAAYSALALACPGFDPRRG